MLRLSITPEGFPQIAGHYQWFRGQIASPAHVECPPAPNRAETVVYPGNRSMAD